MKAALIVFAVIAGAGVLYGIYRIVLLVRSGIDRVKDIADMIEDGDAEAQSRPKSLSNVDRFMLPRILRDFPEFDTALMARRAEQDCLSYLRSIHDRTSYFTEKDAIRSFLEQVSERVRCTNHVVPWNDPVVHGAALSNYENRSNYCYVTYQVAYQYRYNERTWQKKMEIRYLAADEPDMEKKISVFNCPNCGAPISSIGQKVCRYCGTRIDPSARLSWYIFDVNEME